MSQESRNGETSTPRTFALMRSMLNGDKSAQAEALRASVLVEHALQLERELTEARKVQAHTVQAPDGSQVAAPCAISGCQYSARSERRDTTPTAEQRQFSIDTAVAHTSHWPYAEREAYKSGVYEGIKIAEARLAVNHDGAKP